MALAGNESQFDAEEEFNKRVLDGLREKPFQWGTPKGVEIVTAAEAAAQREAREERKAEAESRYGAEQQSILEQLQSGEIQGTPEFDARFDEAVAGAVDAKATSLQFAMPNPSSPTYQGDLIRWRERVAADERAKIAEAAKPAEAERPDSGYFDDLDAEQHGTVDDLLDDLDDEGVDPYAVEEDGLEGELDWSAFEPAE